MKSPAPKDYRMPAEWEPHTATWIGWPHNQSDWPGKMSVIPWVYGEMARRIAEGETLRILVNSQKHEQRARRVLERAHARMEDIVFHRWPTNRGWTRDFGPICVRHKKEVAIVDFTFNAWARYPHWKKDNAIPARAAKALSLKRIPALHEGNQVVLEGGAIDVNGKGTLLTTEECFLDPNVQVRNPGFTRNDYEQVFRKTLGIRHTVWLGKGIAGDDTHGHVDDVCRFVNATTVVLVREDHPKDDNHWPLAENRERLEEARLANGERLQVVDLPMPAPLYQSGRRLPASYANFYICNAAVLVPTFNDPNDRIALGILSELFTDRPVIGIHAVDLVWGLGTLHCLTQQEPAGRVGQYTEKN